MKFEQIGGVLCLDFANTVHCYSCENVRDDLHDLAAFVEWNKQWGALSETEAEGLIREAQRKTADATGILERVKQLRFAIYQLFAAIAEDRTPQKSQLSVLNDVLAEGLGQLRLSLTSDRSFEWTWVKNGGGIERLLWPIARSAAELLISEDRLRVRQCNGERCTWLFVDMSKNKSRRWCTMADCGNRAKARRFYERTRG
jgi:predicted RNA-binding Zn ribbon-like protein